MCFEVLGFGLCGWCVWVVGLRWCGRFPGVVVAWDLCVLLFGIRGGLGLRF